MGSSRVGNRAWGASEGGGGALGSPEDSMDDAGRSCRTGLQGLRQVSQNLPNSQRHPTFHLMTVMGNGGIMVIKRGNAMCASLNNYHSL